MMNKLQEQYKQVYVIAENEIIGTEYLLNHAFCVVTGIT